MYHQRDEVQSTRNLSWTEKLSETDETSSATLTLSNIYFIAKEEEGKLYCVTASSKHDFVLVQAVTVICRKELTLW